MFAEAGGRDWPVTADEVPAPLGDVKELRKSLGIESPSARTEAAAAGAGRERIGLILLEIGGLGRKFEPSRKRSRPASNPCESLSDEGR
jgi:hypothetical protein